MFLVRQGWEGVCELSVVKAGQPTGVAQLYDINSLHKWPKITLAVTAAVTSSLTLGKHYFCLLHLKKTLTKFGMELQSVFEKADLHCLSVHCGLQSSLLWPTKDTESMLPMMCTSHLHMQCKFVPSELTNTDSRNRSVPQKRIDVLSLLPLMFLQIKATFIVHDWFKNFCAIQSVLLSPASTWSEQLHTGRLLRFCQYNLNLLWGLQDWSTVAQVQSYGSWKLKAVQASYLQSFKFTEL